MNRKLLVASLVLMTATAACKRETPASPEAAAPAAPAQAVTPAPIPQADVAATDGQPNAAGILPKAFAGTFKGVLPCADCPGIEETVQLQPDGNFVLIDVYQERPQGTHTIDGTWTIESRDTQIRLDPNTKAEQDRLFAITSNDQISQLDADGKPPASGLEYSLRRAP